MARTGSNQSTVLGQTANTPLKQPVNNFARYRNLAGIGSDVYSELVNCHFTSRTDSFDPTDIVPVKNLGFTQYGTNVGVTSKRGLALGSYQPSTGTAGLYASFGQYVYLLSTGDPVKQDATHPMTDNLDGEFTQVNDDLLYSNGTDAVRKLSGGTWTVLSSGEPLSTAVAKYTSWWHFMLMASNTGAAPNKLNVSNAGDAYTYAGNTKTFTGGSIIGQRALGDYFVIYTQENIHVITGSVPSALNFREVANPHPCVSHRSIATVEGHYNPETGSSAGLEHFYAGADYCWAFNGSSFRILGKNSWESFRTQLNTTVLNKCSGYWDRVNLQYRLSVCTGANTVPNETWAYDVFSDKWIQMPYQPMVRYATHYGTSPSPTHYALDANATGKVYQLNNGNDIIALSTTTTDNPLSASATTINCASTTGLPASGVKVIEGESFYHSGVTATSFTGCIRGYSGTVATTHASGKSIYVAPKFKYTTKYLDENQPDYWKRYKFIWSKIRATSSNQNLDLQANVDEQGFTLIKQVPLKNTGATWGSFTWGLQKWGAPSNVEYANNRASVSGRGRAVKYSWEENSNLSQTQLLEFEYKYRPVKIR